jgi:hypothetical protein
MIQKLKVTLRNALIVAALFLPVGAMPVVVHAADAGGKSAVSCGAEVNLGATDCTVKKGSATKVNSLIADVINILSVVVGVVAVIMIIIGGFKYITSSGDSNNVASAKNTIIYAIVGLIIVALAQVIVRFVLGAL